MDFIPYNPTGPRTKGRRWQMKTGQQLNTEPSGSISAIPMDVDSIPFTGGAATPSEPNTRYLNKTPPPLESSLAAEDSLHSDLHAPTSSAYNPEINPQQSLEELNDEDEFSGQGEGCEEAETEGNADTPTASSSFRQSTPPYIQQAYNLHKAAWLEHDAGNSLPRLYALLSTFWVPTTSPVIGARKHQASLSPAQFYNPRFFVWDILGYVPSLRCVQKNCRGSLARRGFMDRPRRVVDLSDCYWLMGARYYCATCKKSVVSWDRGLLDQLSRSDPDLAAAFPAHLTHRSGMDKALFAFMSTAFSSGLGPRQFSDALRVRHKEAFDYKHIQYLKAIHRISLILPGQQYKVFGTFDGDYAGFVPSASWLRDLWDNEIEKQRPLIKQYMSMLPIRVIGMDHSHKIAARITHTFGSRIFSANMDMTTEFGEIRLTVFTSTKAHEAFEPSFQAVQNSVERYGQEGPQVVYTDNVSDAPMLMHIFPSLNKGV